MACSKMPDIEKSMSITRYKFQILLSLLIFLAASSCRPAESQKELDSYSDPGEQTPSPTLPKSSLTQESEDESSELYRDESMGFTVRLPSIWEQEKSQSGMVNFSGGDGFVRIKTLSSGGMTLEEITLAEAYHELSPFGTEPQVDLIPLQGRITYRILYKVGSLTEYYPPKTSPR